MVRVDLDFLSAGRQSKKGKKGVATCTYITVGDTIGARHEVFNLLYLPLLYNKIHKEGILKKKKNSKKIATS